MFVKSNEFSQYFRREQVRHDRVRGSITLENAMRHEPFRSAVRFDFVRRLTKGESFGLRKDICYKKVMVPAIVESPIAESIE